MSANILIISMEQFPYESAGSLRILNFCKLLKEEKYNPIVLCRNKDNKSGLFEGIMYKSIYSTNRFVKLLKYPV